MASVSLRTAQLGVKAIIDHHIPEALMVSPKVTRLQRLAARIKEGRSGTLMAARFRALKELGFENQ